MLNVKMDKKKCLIYFINSVKGGSGKTTVALSLAYTYMDDLEEQYRNVGVSENIKEPKVCYIDLDMLGTGVKHIIYGNTSEELKYFNDTDPGVKDIKDFKKYINKIDRVGSKFTIDCILLNADGRKKKSFIKGNNYISMNIFLERAKNLLKAFIKEKMYDVIVIDSSPTYDGFSRELYRFLKNISKDFSKENNYSINVYNLFISTFENSHVLTNISCLADLISSPDIEAENIKLVLNDTTDCIHNEKVKEKLQYLTYGKKTGNTLDCLQKKILEEYNNIYIKALKNINCQYSPSQQSFNEKSIVYKKYCEVTQKNIFSIGNQLNGSDYTYILDNDLLEGLRS